MAAKGVRLIADGFFTLPHDIGGARTELQEADRHNGSRHPAVFQSSLELRRKILDCAIDEAVDITYHREGDVPIRRDVQLNVKFRMVEDFDLHEVARIDAVTPVDC